VLDTASLDSVLGNIDMLYIYIHIYIYIYIYIYAYKHFFLKKNSFSDGTFDAVLDKAFLDSVLANYDRIQLWKKMRAKKSPDPILVQQGPFLYYFF
jgi:hypothetical protein